jgi:hypothetical protein
VVGENRRLKIIKACTCRLNHKIRESGNFKSGTTSASWTIQHQKIISVPDTQSRSSVPESLHGNAWFVIRFQSPALPIDQGALLDIEIRNLD